MDNIDLSKYLCPICQMVFEHPKIIQKCEHIFCKNCLFSVMSSDNDDNKHNKNGQFQCPLCRINFIKTDIISKDDLKKEIKNTSYTCKCGVTMKLSNYNSHFNNCGSIQDEIKDSIQNNIVKDAKPEVNRVTFNCTLCNEKNFDRKGYIKHISKQHKNNDYGVCAICLCQPWGDPNYKTHLQGHLSKRHQFDYDTTVDYNNNEDEVLQQVLLASMNDI